ncbi:MAG: DUF4845 domain-containing protein [Rhodocyclaceae bacterium]
MKHSQRGVSLVGLVIIASLLGFVLLVGFRCVPAINEYMAVQRIVKAVAEEGDNGASMTELRRSFDHRAQIDNVSTIGGKDLDIYKQGGKVVVEAKYGRKVPIAANVSLFFDFHAKSTP